MLVLESFSLSVFLNWWGRRRLLEKLLKYDFWLCISLLESQFTLLSPSRFLYPLNKSSPLTFLIKHTHIRRNTGHVNAKPLNHFIREVIVYTGPEWVKRPNKKTARYGRFRVWICQQLFQSHFSFVSLGSWIIWFLAFGLGFVHREHRGGRFRIFLVGHVCFMWVFLEWEREKKIK